MKNLKPLFTVLMSATLCLTAAMVLSGCSHDSKLPASTSSSLEIPLDEFVLNEEQAPTPSSPKYGSSYNQKTHVLVSKGGAGFARFWPPVDGSEYNSVKIKYQVKEGCNFGTIFTIAYKVSETQNYDVAYYLPSYITEFEFPLLNDKKVR